MLFDSLPDTKRPPKDLPPLNTGSRWAPPFELPSLKGVKKLGFDTETYDPDLETLGPGFRRDAYVVGMSLALDDDGPRMYIPVRHQGGGNLDERIVKRWVLDELQNFDAELVGANIAYDLDGMAAPQFGVTFPNVKRFRDVLVAEPLLDEWRLSYSLDNVMKARLGEGKAYDHVHRVMKAVGWKTEREFKKNLWRLPAWDVGEYAEGDADGPMRCLDVQMRQMDVEDREEGVHLREVFDLECDLIPILVAMRIRGVRVDVRRALEIKRELGAERDMHLSILRSFAGPKAELMAPDSFVKALDDRGLEYPLTGKTHKPSITREWLDANAGDACVDAIIGGRRVTYIISTFIEGHIFRHSINGRIHPTFKQLKGGGDRDDGNSDDTSGTIARFCLSGGTEIMVPGGIKLIEDVQVDDLVYGYDDKQKLIIQKVKWAGKTGLRKVVRVGFHSGRRTLQKTNAQKQHFTVATKRRPSITLYMTPDHQVRLADGSYKEAQCLKHGDRVMALSRSTVRWGEYPSLRVFGDRTEHERTEHRVVYMITHGYDPLVDVHHLDENRTNAKPNNLEGLSRSEHQKRHMTHEEASRRAKLAHARFGDKITTAAGVTLTAYSKLRAPPEKMLSLWEEGKSISYIARTMSVGKPTVRKRLTELGIDIQPKNNHQVISVEEVSGLHEVYDIEVENYHNFIANEVCVHNSCTSPNLQNIPARDPYLGPLIRSMYLPEEGEDWESADASQIEYRYLVNFAVGRGADAARARYNADPKTDFHNFAGDMLGADASDGFIRKRVKNTNFCEVYGGGDDKLAATFGCSLQEAIEFKSKYRHELPFVGETRQKASKWAMKRGFIVTVLGRKQRFPFFEQKRRQKDENGNYIFTPPLPYQDAVAAWGKGNVRRAWGHKALNRKLQGSGADHMKAWMVKAWKAGVHQVLGSMLVTVHDEGNNSVPHTAEGREAAAEFKRCGETCIEGLRVPILIKSKSGPNWGSCE